jgi:predicted metal-dependent hydrolase
MESITISSIKIDLIHKAIKNIHLAVYPPTGRVRIAAPLRANKDAIRLFAISKLAWIRRNQRKFHSQERISPREYKQRESHYFQGKRYLLNIIEMEATPKVELKNKTHINLYVRPKTSVEKSHEIMSEWYRAELKKQCPAYIEKWEKLLNVKVNDWQIKRMKTMWGSCNIEAKRIWLNLELAKKPERCLEYIIAHEMVHLLERHHNDTFFHHLKNNLSNWRQLKTELNKLPVSHEEWNY